MFHIPAHHAVAAPAAQVVADIAPAAHQAAVANPTRNIFVIVAAFPVEVQYHELPRVRVDSYVVEGATLQAAFERINDFADMVGAVEVFGSFISDVLICADNTHRREEQLSQWEHWSNGARRGELDQRATEQHIGWTLLHSGPESFRQRIDREFAERNPKFA